MAGSYINQQKHHRLCRSGPRSRKCLMFTYSATLARIYIFVMALGCTLKVINYLTKLQQIYLPIIPGSDITDLGLRFRLTSKIRFCTSLSSINLQAYPGHPRRRPPNCNDFIQYITQCSLQCCHSQLKNTTFGTGNSLHRVFR